MRRRVGEVCQVLFKRTQLLLSEAQLLFKILIELTKGTKLLEQLLIALDQFIVLGQKGL